MVDSVDDARARFLVLDVDQRIIVEFLVALPALVFGVDTGGLPPALDPAGVAGQTRQFGLAFQLVIRVDHALVEVKQQHAVDFVGAEF